MGEQGTGNNDGRVSVITTDGRAFPFLVGLPSEILEVGPSGTGHVYFDVNGDLLILQGEGSDSLSESILTIDPCGIRAWQSAFWHRQLKSGL